MTYMQVQMDAMNRGREEGFAIGEARGRSEGIAIGEARGREVGRTEGVSLMAKLATLLARDGKFDEISRAGIDENFLSFMENHIPFRNIFRYHKSADDMTFSDSNAAPWSKGKANEQICDQMALYRHG